MSDMPTNEQLPPDAASADPRERVLLDPRHPRLLDDREQVLEVKAGHVDVFAVDNRRRHHLFRIEAGEIILDLQTACSGGRLQVVAVGGAGAELTRLPRARMTSIDQISRWVNRLAQLVIAPGFPGMVGELVAGQVNEMQPGERRRGPMRSVAWTRIVGGTANFMGLEPGLAPADLQDGTYTVRLVLRDRAGQTYRESKTFVIASKVPTVEIKLAKTRYRRGEAVPLQVRASQNTRTVVAHLDGAAPVSLQWDAKAGASTGSLLIPDQMIPGTYHLTVTAEDIAHNTGTKGVDLEIVP